MKYCEYKYETYNMGHVKSKNWHENVSVWKYSNEFIINQNHISYTYSIQHC